MDEIELTIELGPRPLDPLLGPGPISTSSAFLDQSAEKTHLVEPVGAGIRRQIRGDQRKVERTLEPQFSRPLHRTGIASEPGRLLSTRPQMHTRWREPTIDLIEAAPGTHCGQSRGKSLAGDRVVMGIGGSDDIDPTRHSEFGEDVIADRIGW